MKDSALRVFKIIAVISGIALLFIIAVNIASVYQSLEQDTEESELDLVFCESLFFEIEFESNDVVAMENTQLSSHHIDNVTLYDVDSSEQETINMIAFRPNSENTLNISDFEMDEFILYPNECTADGMLCDRINQNCTDMGELEDEFY